DVAPTGEGLPEDAFAVPAAVGVGGVEEGHAQVQAALNGTDRLGVIDAAITHPAVAVPEGTANAPAPHADHARLKAAAADADCLHERLPTVEPSAIDGIEFDAA